MPTSDMTAPVDMVIRGCGIQTTHLAKVLPSSVHPREWRDRPIAATPYPLTVECGVTPYSYAPYYEVLAADRKPMCQRCRSIAAGNPPTRPQQRIDRALVLLVEHEQRSRDRLRSTQTGNGASYATGYHDASYSLLTSLRAVLTGEAPPSIHLTADAPTDIAAAVARAQGAQAWT